jgi:formylglycine-generating enzyme required for sulfatase activity
MNRHISSFVYAVGCGAALSFNSHLLALTLEMVPIGNVGNAADTRYGSTGFGSVDYNYRIGKYEVTAGQYTEFLNAVAKADPIGLYNASMGNPGEGFLGANIRRAGTSPTYSYSVAAAWANRPVNFVSFWDAARFANWLHNGQPTGAQGPATTEDGAYHDVGNDTLFGRRPGAKFFIPSEDEWYKAAYHNKAAGLAASYFDFPTGTIAMPGTDITETTNTGNNANNYVDHFVIGGPYYRTVAGEFELSDSPYGTFDQAGNVYEWNEASEGTVRCVRGGGFDGDSFPFAGTPHASERYFPAANFEQRSIGFRVAGLMPEPGDYSGDGQVDAADYVRWRDGLGTAYTQADYDVWRANFDAATSPPVVDPPIDGNRPFFNPATGHWYDFVSAPDISWSDAKSASEAMMHTPENRPMLMGYLATITSEAEETFLKTHFGENALVWVGASDASVEGEWRWVTGPEGVSDDGKGVLFWLGNQNGTAVGFENWIDGIEPNGLGEDEDYIDWNHNSSGRWNDVAADTPRDVISGYFVEFGSSLPTVGDFNADGSIDAADYVVWRDGLGSTHTQADYDVWRANFSTFLAPAADQIATSAPAVPEQKSVLLIGWSPVLVLSRRSCRTTRNAEQPNNKAR